MKAEIWFFLFLVACVAGTAAVSLGVANWAGEKRCAATWAGSNMPYRWGFWERCLVQRTDGTWVPASAIRDLGQ